MGAGSQTAARQVHRLRTPYTRSGACQELGEVTLIGTSAVGRATL
jgi:hypothetical protein